MKDPITGVQLVVKQLEGHKKAIKSALVFTQLQIARTIKELADYYVPKDTLALLNSGGIEIVGYGDYATARVTYGGPDAPYALYVHEDMSKLHRDPECAKWLERATKEKMEEAEMIAKGVFGGRIAAIKNYSGNETYVNFPYTYNAGYPVMGPTLFGDLST